MMQRIQSIWLVLVIASATVAFFIPFGTEFVSAFNTEAVNGVPMNAQTNTTVLIFIAIIIIDALIAIFSYTNRSLQKWLCLIIALLSLVSIAFMVYTAGFQNENTSIHFGILSPIMCLVFSLLAYRGIHKDDKLVKNLDRLR